MIWMLLPSALATTITVNSGGSIQSAINSASNGDVIDIQSGTYLECLNPSGRNLTFQGNGTVVLNGSSCPALFTVENSEQITIQNLQMSHSNGLVVEVTSETASVTINNVTVSNSGYSYQGISSEGGVIHSVGSIVISNSTFTGNTGGIGGVIFMDGGFLSMSDNNFSANSGLKGGVVYAKDGTTIVSNNNVFSNNSTVNGGFGGIYYLAFGISLTDTGSEFSNNDSDSHAGILYSYNNVSANIPNSIVISDATVENNSAGSSSAFGVYGGAIYTENTTNMSITNSSFTGNTSSGGGAIWQFAAGNMTIIDNCIFDGNIAGSYQGGAIAVMAGGSASPTDLWIANSTFENNQANTSFGGAVSLGNIGVSQSYGDLIVENSTFSNNTTSGSSTASGGAIYVNSSHTVDISGSSFSGNEAYTSGGAVYLNGLDEISISTTRFTGNTTDNAASYDRYGGALFINGNSSSTSVDLNNSLFCGNSVLQYPNKAAHGAGGYIQNAAMATIHNVIFQDNESDQNGGGLSIDSISLLELVNNNFVGNTAGQGAGLWLSGSSSDLINNIFYDNAGVGAYANDSMSASNGATYSDWNGNTSNTAGSFSFSVLANGNTTALPDFESYVPDGNCENDNFVLASTSTLINAGDPSIFDSDNTRSDIGAFGGAGLIDNDGDGYGALMDCDDNDPSAFPGAASQESSIACMIDNDNDGFGDSNPSNPNVTPGQDCDDTAFLINPNAPETCDGIDNNCNNQIDDNPIGGSNYYQDLDQDGYGGNTITQACSQQPGYTTTTGDCDDLDPYAFPGAAENESSTSCRRDVDGDGYGDMTPSNSSVTSGGDCNDMQPNISPIATEITADGVDQNCDGAESCYLDLDGDGYGGNSTTTSTSLTCSVGLAISASNNDCDDNSGQTFPGAAEYDSATACMADEDGDGYGSIIAPVGGIGGNDCNDDDPLVYFGAPEIVGDGISQDCNNTELCYADEDGDGYGSSETIVSNDLDCSDSGESDNSEDCDDSDTEVAPDLSEIPYDGIDNDCDEETVDDDLDGDGYGLSTGDCDDGNPALNPGATDIPDNGIDEDCSGADATSSEPAVEPTAEPDTGEPSAPTNEPSVDTEDITKDDNGCKSSSSDAFLFMTFVALFSARRRQS